MTGSRRAANPRQAQRANAVNATCADAASASLVFIAGQSQPTAVRTARHCLLARIARPLAHATMLAVATAPMSAAV